MARILVIDDEPLVTFTISEMLSDGGHQPVESLTAKEGIRILGEKAFDCLIVDIVMPEMDGIEAIQAVSAHWPDLPIIAITGSRRSMSYDYFSKAQELADAVLEKPFESEELLASVNQVLPVASKGN